VDTLTRPPGVLVELVEPAPPIEPARIDVPVVVGVFARGPVDTAVRIASWPHFLARFGGFVAQGLGAYAVKAVFEQGGRLCWVVRVAAPRRDTSAAGPQPSDRASTVVASLDGLVAGAAATIRQGAAAHTYLVVAVDAVTSTVRWDRPLHPDIDTSLPFAVESGAGVAAGALTDEAGAARIELTAASPGTWADGTLVVATPGKRSATRNRPGAPADPSAVPVERIDGFAPGTTVVVTQDLAGVVTAATVEVAAVAAADRVLVFTGPLPGAIDPTALLTVEAETTTLTVVAEGAVVEVHLDLDLAPAGDRFVETVLQSSDRIRARVVGAGSLPTQQAVLANGRNGTAALSVDDLLGSETELRGLAASVDLPEPALVILPDLVAEPAPPVVHDPELPDVDPCAPCPPPASPPPVLEASVSDAGATFSLAEIARVQQALVEHCERDTERIAILDLPAGSGPLDRVAMSDWVRQFSSTYAVASGPWLRVLDPIGGTVRPLRRVPGSGHLAGLFAAVDAEAGPWRAAANRSLRWAHQLDRPISDGDHALLNEAGLDVIRAVPGRGLVMLGARTLSADALWLFSNVRRTMIFLRRSLRQALAWAVFEPNDARLDATVATAVGSLLEGVWEAGGLAGGTPDEAFYVVTGSGDRGVGQFVCEIGVALERPAEFVTVRVLRLENRLELREAPEPGRVP
jgi:uncharacterized protein